MLSRSNVSGVQVFGVGSPHGDDQAGWQLIERLRQAGVPAEMPAEMAAVKDPLDMVQRLGGGRPVVIVDACVSGGVAGTITRCEWPAARFAPPAGRSTHSLQVADALQLAQRLGRLPRSVVIFGIEIEQCSPCGALSPPVEQALPALGRQVLEEIRELQHA